MPERLFVEEMGIAVRIAEEVGNSEQMAILNRCGDGSISDEEKFNLSDLLQVLSAS
jgi:hypothetical protein